MEAITASEGNSHQAVRNGWRGQDLTEDAQAGKMSQTGGRQPGAPHLEKTAEISPGAPVLGEPRKAHTYTRAADLRCTGPCRCAMEAAAPGANGAITGECVERATAAVTTSSPQPQGQRSVLLF